VSHMCSTLTFPHSTKKILKLKLRIDLRRPGRVKAIWESHQFITVVDPAQEYPNMIIQGL